MNNSNHRREHPRQEEQPRKDQRQQVRGGFDGMNFEEQRGSLKNSDLGGAVPDKKHGMDKDRHANR